MPKVDFWDELSEEEQNLIKQGVQDLDNRKRVSYQKVINELWNCLAKSRQKKLAGIQFSSNCRTSECSTLPTH